MHKVIFYTPYIHSIYNNALISLFERFETVRLQYLFVVLTFWI